MKRFAVIGYGHIGRRHAQTIINNPNSTLVAVVEPQFAHIGQELRGFEQFTSLDALFESGLEIDVVSICTPNGLHSDQAVDCLNAGWHVLIEKPMGLSAAKCEEVIATAQANERQAFCVMQNRYSPPSQWLKEVITKKLMGEIYLVDVKCFWNRDDRYYGQPDQTWRGSLNMDGGTLYTQFSHFIDLVYWLFGDFKDIEADLKDYNHHDLTEFEDTGVVKFTLGERTTGLFTFSTAVTRKNFESSITIIGEKGTIKVGGQYMNEVQYCEVENYTMPELASSNPANQYGAYQGSANNHPLVIQNVIDVLEGRARITTTAREGKEVVDIIERIYSKNR